MSVGNREEKCEAASLHPQQPAHQQHPLAPELPLLLRPLTPESACVLVLTQFVSTAFGLCGCAGRGSKRVTLERTPNNSYHCPGPRRLHKWQELTLPPLRRALLVGIRDGCHFFKTRDTLCLAGGGARSPVAPDNTSETGSWCGCWSPDWVAGITALSKRRKLHLCTRRLQAGQLGLTPDPGWSSCSTKTHL